MPDPLLPIAIRAKSKADEDKLPSQALYRVVAEDPTLRLDHNPETHQLVLWCMGGAHVDVVLDRLKNRYGVEVDTVPYMVALQGLRGQGHGPRAARQAVGWSWPVRHLRHRGRTTALGRWLRVRRQGRGRRRTSAVHPLGREGRTHPDGEGVSAGYPVVDFRVTLVDGKAHSVDSSDMAFQTAGALALREAASSGSVSLLEPVAEVSVLVADEYVGGS